MRDLHRHLMQQTFKPVRFFLSNFSAVIVLLKQEIAFYRIRGDFYINI